ncbi:hypothetical protein KUV62_09340 [Salipiger bermudensis]|uniref:hypothetical protein n=1 Tax=Salipiger bermudensis TaxID=344736 RepID=UPI001C99B8EE|nr:hypothetical protein [Salipiger bermudensis]MBY6004110.1 hypothetical protein [Salipiger bermudensis]
MPQILTELGEFDDFPPVNIVDSVKIMHVQEKPRGATSARRDDSRTETRFG